MREYGNDQTIHGSTHLDVEVDKGGKVVAVWFRCCLLPFRQANADDERAKAMKQCYKAHIPALHAVKVDP